MGPGKKEREGVRPLPQYPLQGQDRAEFLEKSEKAAALDGEGRKQTHNNTQRHEGAHHGRDDPGDTDGVPTASIRHSPPVQDVQAGIQHSMIKLEGGRAEVTPRSPTPSPHPTGLFLPQAHAAMASHTCP